MSIQVNATDVVVAVVAIDDNAISVISAILILSFVFAQLLFMFLSFSFMVIVHIFYNIKIIIS